MKTLFIAGGSGGHITPALAVADVLQEKHPKDEIVFVSTNTPLDEEIFLAHDTQYRRHTIPVVKFRRYFSLQNIIDIFKFPVALWKSFSILRKEKPNIIFSKGGFVAVPVGIAAKFCRIPLVIHESDTAAGLANRMLRKIASKILTAFPLPFGECVGNPVREEIFLGDATKGRTFLGFPKEEKVILVMGGSQGAEPINTLLLHSAGAFQEKACVVHISGKGKSVQQETTRYRHFSYLGAEFPDVLAAADIVISRAGANSLFEIAAAKKPSILIPLPSAANNHQRTNAQFFEQKKLALVLEEKSCTSAQFQNTVLSLLDDEKKCQKIASQIGVFARKNAAEKIADILSDSVREKEKKDAEG